MYRFKVINHLMKPDSIACAYTCMNRHVHAQTHTHQLHSHMHDRMHTYISTHCVNKHISIFSPYLYKDKIRMGNCIIRELI